MTHFVPSPPEVSPHLNMRQELFCRAIIQWMSATQAARLAGYSEISAHVQGSRMLRNDKVCLRIAELRGEEEFLREKEVASALEMLEGIVGSARRTGSYAAALRGLEMRLKLRGVLPLGSTGGRVGDLRPLPQVGDMAIESVAENITSTEEVI